MPNSLLAADTLFPKVDESKTQNENLRTVTNYLYMLVEELRYTFNNLGVSNFNEAEIDELANIITEPVYIQLADDEGNIAALLVQVDSLFSRIQDAEGNISSIQQTATVLESRMQDAEGDISTLTQTTTSIEGRVSTIAGDVSTLSLNVNGLATRVQSAEGSISTLTQTANSLSSRITDAEGNVSSLAYTVDGITITDRWGTTYVNGGMISSNSITGNQIQAKTITGDNIEANIALYSPIIYATSGDPYTYSTMAYDGFSIYIDGNLKCRIGELSGSYTNQTIILGADNPLCLSKQWRSKHFAWIGDEYMTCGIAFDFTAGTYQLVGTPGTIM